MPPDMQKPFNGRVDPYITRIGVNKEILLIASDENWIENKAVEVVCHDPVDCER